MNAFAVKAPDGSQWLVVKGTQVVARTRSENAARDEAVRLNAAAEDARMFAAAACYADLKAA